jgi:hypothetical protein
VRVCVKNYKVKIVNRVYYSTLVADLCDLLAGSSADPTLGPVNCGCCCALVLKILDAKLAPDLQNTTNNRLNRTGDPPH